MKALLIYDPKNDRKFGHFFSAETNTGINRQLAVELDSPARSNSVFELPIPGTQQLVAFCVRKEKEPPQDSGCLFCYDVVPIAISVKDDNTFHNFIETDWKKGE